MKSKVDKLAVKKLTPVLVDLIMLQIIMFKKLNITNWLKNTIGTSTLRFRIIGGAGIVGGVGNFSIY